jgi:predicted transcriptional regulator
MAEMKTVHPRLVAEIVGRYVSHNSIAATDLQNLIATIHRSLAGLGQPEEASVSSKPAVAINRSYGRDFVVCLDRGWRGQMLRTHLTTAHHRSPAEYRSRWGLKLTHPLIAPAYSERRSTLAKQVGLGRGRSASTAPETPKRRGRPRRTAPAPSTP